MDYYLRINYFGTNTQLSSPEFPAGSNDWVYGFELNLKVNWLWLEGMQYGCEMLMTAYLVDKDDDSL